MKIDQYNKTYKSTGKSTTMSLEDDPVAYSIIFDSLYSDKIGASLRETGQNAMDSRVEAGWEQKPFQIKVPTWADPVVVIRDFGPGMSEEFMLDNYCRIFLSSKREDRVSVKSELLRGGFGMGRLAPLSYVDSYSVTSIHNGVKSFYTVGKNAVGKPAVTLLHSEPTNEPSGVEVAWSVKPADIQTYKDKIKGIFGAFNPRPEVDGIEWPEKDLVLDGGFYRIYSGSYSDKALVGGIAYEYPANKVLRMPYGKYMEFDVDINSVDISASRESLSYTDKTNKTISETLDRVKEDLQKKLEVQLKGAKCFWEACRVWDKIPHKYTDLEWNGRRLAKYHYPTGIKSCTTLLTGRFNGSNSINTETEIIYHYTGKERFAYDRVKTAVDKDTSGKIWVWIKSDSPYGLDNFKKDVGDCAVFIEVDSLPMPNGVVPAKKPKVSDHYIYSVTSNKYFSKKEAEAEKRIYKLELSQKKSYWRVNNESNKLQLLKKIGDTVEFINPRHKDRADKAGWIDWEARIAELEKDPEVIKVCSNYKLQVHLTDVLQKFKNLTMPSDCTVWNQVKDSFDKLPFINYKGASGKELEDVLGSGVLDTSKVSLPVYQLELKYPLIFEFSKTYSYRNIGRNILQHYVDSIHELSVLKENQTRKLCA